MYCYCCIVGIVVLLSKVSDYSNKFRLGLGRCHLEQRAYCLNVNWKIQVDTMSHFLIRLIDLQGVCDTQSPTAETSFFPDISTVKYELTPLILDLVMGRRSISLTFRYVDEYLWCYHSNETSLADVLRCTISFVKFSTNRNFDFFVNFYHS